MKQDLRQLYSSDASFCILLVLGIALFTSCATNLEEEPPAGLGIRYYKVGDVSVEAIKAAEASKPKTARLTVALAYTPQGVTRSSSAQSVTVGDFNDVRKREGIGETFAPTEVFWWFLRTAIVFADQDLRAFTADALAKELTASGYTVNRIKDVPPDQGAVLIEGTILTWWGRAQVDAGLDIKIRITIKKAGKVIMKKEFSAGGLKINWSGNELSEHEKVTRLTALSNKAIEEVIRKAAVEIGRTLK